MSSAPKNMPRFLPTLTEVVSPSQAATMAPAPVPAIAMPQPDAQRIIERVMQQLEPTLEARLRDVLGAVVAEHMRALEPRLWQEVEQTVLDVVTQAVTAELESRPGNAGH